MEGCVTGRVNPFGTTVRNRESYSVIYPIVVCVTQLECHHCQLVLGLNKQSKYKTQRFKKLLKHKPHTRGMSKLSSDRLHFARKGHETVALAQSYFANIPEGSRYVLLAVASSRSKLELVKDGNAHRKSRRLRDPCSHPISTGQEYPTSRYSQTSV